MNLPEEYLKQMTALLGENTDEYFASLSLEPVRAVRINEQKISADEFVDKCGLKLGALPFSDKCKLLVGAEKVGRTPFHHGGAFYVQEPGAMLPVLAAKIEPTDKILDLCASPGGKTIQAALIATDGQLLSNEIDYKRAVTLAGNVERMGLKNVVVSNASPEVLEKYYDEWFDVVIVDAPCSGEGMFRKEQLAPLNWSKQNVLGCASRQKNILDSANKMLRGGGIMIYSTCTFSLEEDEENVAYMCEKYGYELIKPNEIVFASSTAGVSVNGLNGEYMRRVYPHVNVGEGQFFAVMKKSGLAKGKMRVAKHSSADKCAPFVEFRKKYMTSCPPCVLVGDSVIALSGEYPDGLKPISRGVKMGDVVNNRFVPHHNLYTAYGNLIKNRLDVDCAVAEKYLRGEEIECDQSGYVCVYYEGVALGGGKASGGTLKNHYPKGLRNA